jgi:hypothetical protein
VILMSHQCIAPETVADIKILVGFLRRSDHISHHALTDSSQTRMVAVNRYETPSA